MSWSINHNKCFLRHEGILGQKWGVRNGPPYPLGYDDHSSAEKSKNPKSRIDGKSDTNSKTKKGLTDKQKTAIKIGAIVAGASLVAIGGYELYKHRDSIKALVKSGKEGIPNIGSGLKTTKLSAGKSINEIDKQMVSSINKSNYYFGGPDYHINCAHTSIAYVLNSTFGNNFKAKPFSGVDEISGLKVSGRDKNVFYSVFDGLNEIKNTDNLGFSDFLSKCPNKSTGILFVSGHFLNYEIDSKGKPTLIDPQVGLITNDIKAINNIYRNRPIVSAIDCTNATIKTGAEEILKHMVK